MVPAADAPDADGDADTAADVWAAYQGYSNTLRTWLVAYGVGAPVLFLTNEAIWKRVAASGEARTLAMLFLCGVGLQVLLAALNKTVMWAIYYGELITDFKQTRRYRVAATIAQQFWIDFVIDLGSMVLFALATYRTFVVLTAAVSG